MVQPTQPQQSIPDLEKITDQAKSRALEMEWEMAVLGAVIAVSRKNSGLQQQLSNIQDDMLSGTPPETLITSINQLIDQINSQLEGAPTPSFEFTSPNNERRSIENYILSFERFVNLAMENNVLSLKDESLIFKKAVQIWNEAFSGQPLFQESLAAFQDLITEVNALLPASYKFPEIPKALYGGKQ